MNEFSKEEQISVNLMPISELDIQIISGARRAVYINDGRIIGTADED
ncbi:hypothetical protein [Clostridium sp. E02]|nr:hypothetical protein [Clostridium sp. E02]